MMENSSGSASNMEFVTCSLLPTFLKVNGKLKQGVV